MRVLGIGGSDHDVASAIAQDGKVLIAIEEERISRHKYALNSNLLLGQSRKYCLNELGMSLDDIDEVIIDDILAETAYHPLRKRAKKIRHHLAHASSVYYPSPFEESAILVVDNAGSLIEENGEKGLETISYGMGTGTKLELFETIKGKNWHEGIINNKVYQRGDSDDSLGHFYKIVSGVIGFKYNENNGFFFPEAGKTMGLAPYGDGRYYEEMKKHVNFGPGGRIKMDFHTGRFEALLENILKEDGGKDDFLCKAHIAFGAQKILEEALLYCCNYLYEQTKSKNLCFAGGVALNCVANGILVEKTPFENIFLFPACGDNGTAIGCALWGSYNSEERSVKDKSAATITSPYFGRSYKSNEVEAALDKYDSISWEKVESAAASGAKLISEGKIIGWFQGGCEFGPRALGHRSIVADPRNEEIKDIINSRIKFREAFRPYAPSILKQHASDYFVNDTPSPFMLLAFEVKEEKRADVPGIVHEDGTARLQTVTKEDNGIYAELIEEFHKLTGVPVVLNTSFNVKGEPIVETPENALNCFLNTNLDALIIEDYLIFKK